MELFDLYTADRERTGRTMVRGEPVPEAQKIGKGTVSQ